MIRILRLLCPHVNQANEQPHLIEEHHLLDDLIPNNPRYHDVKSRLSPLFKRASCLHPSYTSHFHLLNPIYAKSFYQQQKEEMMEEYKEIFDYDSMGKTGWERVKKMYKGMYNINNPEANILQEVAIFGGVVGFMWGSVFKTTDYMQDFIRKHNDMVYEGEYHAKRTFIDNMVVNTARKGASVAWRFALFPAYVTLFALTSLAYRNYVNPLDFGAVVGLAGAIWKFMLGPRAMFTAFCFGALLGIIAGCLLWSVFKMVGITVAEWRYFNAGNRVRAQRELSGHSWNKYLRQLKLFGHRSKDLLELETSVANHDEHFDLTQAGVTFEKIPDPPASILNSDSQQDTSSTDQKTESKSVQDPPVDVSNNSKIVGTENKSK